MHTARGGHTLARDERQAPAPVGSMEFDDFIEETFPEWVKQQHPRPGDSFSIERDE